MGDLTAEKYKPQLLDCIHISWTNDKSLCLGKKNINNIALALVSATVKILNAISAPQASYMAHLFRISMIKAPLWD